LGAWQRQPRQKRQKRQKTQQNKKDDPIITARRNARSD
jgi:hypothetical protein